MQSSDIKVASRSAGIAKNRRAVFNIKGNEYPLVVATAYQLRIDYVQFIGTYQQYDAIHSYTVEPH